MSCEKLKAFYFCFHNIFMYQTWDSGDLGWGTLTHKIIYSLVTCSDNVTWQIRNVSSALLQDLQAPNFEGVVAKVVGSHFQSYMSL